MKNVIECREDGTIVVHLTQGKVAVCDEADRNRIELFRWCAVLTTRPRTRNECWYARNNAVGYLHQFLTGFRRTDHINGDGLDNRRSNLREVTHKQNLANQRLSSANKSGYRGVSWFPRDSKWTAHIKVNGRAKNLGYFTDPADAARAYDRAAIAAWGPHARLNFP